MMFASELGLKPWELGRLTHAQVMGAVAEFDAMIEARDKSNQ